MRSLLLVALVASLALAVTSVQHSTTAAAAASTAGRRPGTGLEIGRLVASTSGCLCAEHRCRLRRSCIANMCWHNLSRWADHARRSSRFQCATARARLTFGGTEELRQPSPRVDAPLDSFTLKRWHIMLTHVPPLCCVSLFVLVCSAAAAGETAVTILTPDNFDSVVGKEQGVFVEFFAPSEFGQAHGQ